MNESNHDQIETAYHLNITAELTPDEESGYSVYCPELDIYTQGKTLKESLDYTGTLSPSSITLARCHFD